MSNQEREEKIKLAKQRLDRFRQSREGSLNNISSPDVTKPETGTPIEVVKQVLETEIVVKQVQETVNEPTKPIKILTEEMQKDIDNQREALTVKESKIQQCEAEINSLKKQLSSIRLEKERSERTILEIQKEVKASNQARNDAQKMVNELETIRISLLAKLSDKESEIKGLKGEIAELQMKCAKLEQNLKKQPPLDNNTQTSPAVESAPSIQKTVPQSILSIVEELNQEKRLISMEMQSIIKENVELQKRCYVNQVERSGLLDQIKVAHERNRELIGIINEKRSLKQEELNARERALNMQGNRMQQLEKELFAKHEAHQSIIMKKGKELEEKMRKLGLLERKEKRDIALSPISKLGKDVAISPLPTNTVEIPYKSPTKGFALDSKYLIPDSPEVRSAPSWVLNLSSETQKVVMNTLMN